MLTKRWCFLVTLITICAVTFSVQPCVWAGIKEPLALKEAYFKEPKQDILVVIETIDKNGTPIEASWGSIEIEVHKSSGSDQDSFRTRTPYVSRRPFTELVKGLKVEYDKMSDSDKQRTILALIPEMTLSISAQSQSSVGCIRGTIYYAGEKQVTDSARVAYGVVNLTYTPPIEEALNHASETSK